MPRRILAAAAATLLLAASAQAQLPPQKALESLIVAPDLQVELFAHEPMLINPTSIDVDHLGRVWVCEAVNYRRALFNRPVLRPEGDRIVILEDTKGAGKADKATVFYQGKDLIAPIGICVVPMAKPARQRGGDPPGGAGEQPRPDGRGSPVRVFVCQSPDILLFEDLDGDGKADGPPKKFLTGFNGFDHDHGVHGINIGPDGKLYFTVGDTGVKNLQSSDGKGRKWNSNSTDCRAGTVWRCDMDGKNLELIAHNFRNNYECCVNSFGEIWLSDNDDDGNEQTRICYVMPGGNYGYHPRGKGESHWHEEQPGVVHKVLRTGFGSPTGICFYEGNLLPERFRGQLLHCDAGPREFRCFHIKPKGAGYEAEKEVLVTSKDSWFRLSDVCVGPDGSVFLADWYDPGVGGHGMGDWTRGRIYRVTPKGYQGYKVPKVDLASKQGLLAAMSSPCLVTRALARAAFLAQDASVALKTLAEAVLLMTPDAIGLNRREHPSPNDYHAARCWWLLQQIAAKKDAPYLKEVDWACSEFRMRIKPIAFGALDTRVLHDVYGTTVAKEKMDGAWPAVATSHPVLNREWILSLRDAPIEQMKPYFYLFAIQYDGQDHFYRAALNIACGTDPARRDAILADFDKHFPEWNDKVADLVWELRPKSVLPRLQTLLADPKLTAAQKGRIVDILAVNDDPAAGKALFNLLRTHQTPEIRQRALENLRLFLPTKWKSLAGSADMKELITALLNQSGGKATGLQLIAIDARAEWIPRVATIAMMREADLADRAEAVRTLGKLPQEQALRIVIQIAGQDESLAGECIKTLGQSVVMNAKDSDAINMALAFLRELISQPKASAETKLAAVSALAGSQSGSAWLINQHELKKLPEGLVAEVGRLLRNSPYQPVRNKAMLAFPPPGKLDPAKLPSIATLAKARGETSRGKQILAASLKGEAQCLKCHTVRGVGGQVGPDLSMIGSKASRENLLESILLPSKAIADQFLQYQVETKSGQQITGLLVQQGPGGVTLRDAIGKDHAFARGDIESMTKSQVSIMPADIVKALSEDELTDLVEYMLTLKTPSLTPEFWHIAGPFANDESDGGLDAVYEPEKKIDLSATYRGKGGDVRWTAVQRNAEGYVDLMAHYAPKSNQIMSYLYREVESQIEQEATIVLGTDDGAKLWVNGTKVYETRAHDAATPDKARVTVKLRKGANTLLLKIVNGAGPHGFYLTLLGQQELKAGK